MEETSIPEVIKSDFSDSTLLCKSNEDGEFGISKSVRAKRDGSVRSVISGVVNH